MKSLKADRDAMVLYAVTDRGWLKGETLEEDVKKALKGGVTFVQLREKSIGDDEFLKEAWALKKLCKEYNVPFVINDRLDIAKAVDANGVHIGQSDGDVRAARQYLGNDKIIGVSAQTVTAALKAQSEGADYLGVGAVFGTTTKSDAQAVLKDELKRICESVDIPVVAIGGINKNNVLKLKGSGIDGAAVISAIFGAEDIENAARELKHLIKTVI